MEKPKPNLSSQKNTQKVDPKVVRAAPLPNPQTPQRQIRPAPNFQAQTIQIIHPGQQSATPLVINNGQIQLPSSASVQSPGQRVVFLQPIQGQNGQVIYTQTPNAATASPQPIQPKLSSTPNQVLIRPVQQPVKTEKGTTTPSRSIQKHNVRITPLGPVPQKTEYNAPNPPKETPKSESITRFICHCSKSKCLKLYCECFRRGEYCHSLCQCNNCLNRDEFQDQRQKAVRIALDRNEDAFKPKVAKSREREARKGKHLRGCNCKRSGCLKKYCECYQAGVPCTAICNCVGCKNKGDHDPFDGGGGVGEPKSKKIRIGATRILQSNITTPVISSATSCLLVAAKGNKSIGPVLDEFRHMVGTIITHTIQSNKTIKSEKHSI